MSGELPAGKVLRGKYRIERVLGKGGMGFVLQATHLDLDRLVATANAGFVLSGTMWHHVDDDSGAGAAGTVTGGTTSNEKVTVPAAAKCA